MVGEQITKLNPMRAFCVSLSAAITVIVASWFGLPVSSTHIAVGAVFGVGFFREWYTAKSRRRQAYMERKNQRWVAERPSDSGEKKVVGNAPLLPSKVAADRAAAAAGATDWWPVDHLFLDQDATPTVVEVVDLHGVRTAIYLRIFNNCGRRAATTEIDARGPYIVITALARLSCCIVEVHRRGEVSRSCSRCASSRRQTQLTRSI